jgi:hypothetical protein
MIKTKLTTAQLHQIEERKMMKNGVFPVFFARPELDVLHSHENACRSFLNSSTCRWKKAQGKTYPEFISKNLYPEHHSKVSLFSVDGNTFLVHTEGTCLTHKLQDENTAFAEDEVELVSPRTIIFDISGDLSDQEISASVRAHELAHAAFPRSVYHIKVCISSRNQSQTIRVSMNLYQLGEDEVCTDGSVRKNLVIEQTEIVPPLVKSDGTAFLAKILDDTTTENILVLSEFECSLTEVVGSICFDAVLTS